METQTAESSGRGTTGEEHAENRADAAQKAGVTFCFGSAGWLFVYYFGVIKRIKELGLHRCFPKKNGVHTFKSTTGNSAHRGVLGHFPALPRGHFGFGFFSI
eukprot:687939-Pyramimonas_sp.AAC.1